MRVDLQSFSAALQSDSKAIVLQSSATALLKRRLIEASFCAADS
jgi:hypothetical protein